MPETIDKSRFAESYTTRPPWDIDGPQPAFNQLRLCGTLLDSGCGSGENALYFASRGLTVTGFDYLEAPIARAREKSRERGLTATFLIKDALTLASWTVRFDNAIDSGVMHVFSDADRTRYIDGIAQVLKPGGRFHVLCFSDATPGTEGPRRITLAELDAIFAPGWALESVTPTRFAVRDEARETLFAGKEPHAWFAVARRLA